MAISAATHVCILQVTALHGLPSAHLPQRHASPSPGHGCTTCPVPAPSPVGDTGLPPLQEGDRPLGGGLMGSRAPCQPAQGRAGADSPSQTPQLPGWRSSAHGLLPATRQEHRPANPLSVPAVPTPGTVLSGTGHWPHSPDCGSGQHGHCQAQPCLLPGHVPHSLGKLGR